MADKDKEKGGKGPAETVEPLSAAQIKMVDKMFEDRIAALKGSLERPANPNSPVSLYNLRDPKEIKSVKVSRFDAKWVLGFKNLQNDPYKKTPKYLRYGVEPIRKLNNEPYVTLILSADGKTKEEKEVLLLDYMENRETVSIPVVKIDVEEKIHDHGVLGSVGAFGVAINEKGTPENRPTILAQSKSEVRTFTVQIPEWEETTEFIADFLG